MKFNISSLIYRFKSYHFSEDDHLIYLRQKLKHIYEDPVESNTRREYTTEEKKIHSQNSENVIKNIKAIYKNNISNVCPWVSNSLWNQIVSIDSSNIPKAIMSDTVRFTNNESVFKRDSNTTKSFSEEVKQSDFKCIERYLSSSRKLPTNKIRPIGLSGIKAALQLGIIKPGREQLKQRSVANSVDSISKNTNSGWPFFRRKNTDVCVKDTKFWLNKMLHKPSYHTIFKNALFSNYTSLFHRVQPSVVDDVCNVKIRQVWCVPQRIIALEHYFFSEILTHVTNNNMSNKMPIYTSGMSNYDISRKVVSRLRNYIGNDPVYCNLFSLDYSKYDSTIPNFGIDLFFSIVKDSLNLTPSEDKCFECLRCYTRNTPLCFRDCIYIKTKGVMSGSYITNLYDTWFNLLLWNLSEEICHSSNNLSDVDFMKHVCFNEASLELFRSTLALCGDDVIIYTTYREISVHRQLCLCLGMTIEVKCSYRHENDDIFFLGRFWDYDNRPKNNETYMISHICFRTKFYSLKDVSQSIIDNLDVYRILSICLPFVNGRDFVNKYFGNWEPMRSFLDSKADFVLLKDWPNDGYRRIHHMNAFNWRTY